ncbi:MAG: hydratase, partial [Agathobacter sp.]|nr:hydratase [Agathobacter sp.]
MKLYENGAYLVNGRDVVINSPEAAAAVNAKTGKTVTPEDAKKQTIAYGILKSHNTSGNMEKLQIKFDKLTSHDITFVGIIQT